MTDDQIFGTILLSCLFGIGSSILAGTILHFSDNQQVALCAVCTVIVFFPIGFLIRKLTD